MEIIRRSFNKRINSAGALTFVEANRDVPFTIKRVYYLYDIVPGEHRGFHAHKTLHQYLICVHGSCRVILDDGREKQDVLLDDPNEGLYVGPSMWREMYDFSDGAVLLVLASEFYDEADYIRDYDEFLRFVSERENNGSSVR